MADDASLTSTLSITHILRLGEQHDDPHSGRAQPVQTAAIDRMQWAILGHHFQGLVRRQMEDMEVTVRVDRSIVAYTEALLAVYPVN